MTEREPENCDQEDKFRLRVLFKRYFSMGIQLLSDSEKEDWTVIDATDLTPDKEKEFIKGRNGF